MKAVAEALGEATELLRSTGTRIAVVGASNDTRKYGNIIVKDLMRRGYEVVPVNLHETTVEGLPVFRSLKDIPEPVDIVDVVTPPESTLEVLKDAAKAGVGLVWLQDGSFDDGVIDNTVGAPFKTVYDACIMVVARKVRASGE